jgi:hypothetical protein
MGCIGTQLTKAGICELWQWCGSESTSSARHLFYC